VRACCCGSTVGGASKQGRGDRKYRHEADCTHDDVQPFLKNQRHRYSTYTAILPVSRPICEVKQGQVRLVLAWGLKKKTSRDADKKTSYNHKTQEPKSHSISAPRQSGEGAAINIYIYIYNNTHRPPPPPPTPALTPLRRGPRKARPRQRIPNLIVESSYQLGIMWRSINMVCAIDFSCALQCSCMVWFLVFLVRNQFQESVSLASCL
jgi:hypothetical protein